MMHRHVETRKLPYSPKQLFDMVADIGRYPEFLPWCQGARITGRSGDTVTADLIVGKGPFRETFTSNVHLTSPKDGTPARIDVDYVRGPLREMENHWVFRAVEGGTEIDFRVAFEFRSRLFNKIMSRLFTDAVRRMVSAFETRARALYGTA